MQIHREYQQGSLEWLRARAGIPTASEFGNLLTPKFEIRTGEMPKSYLAAKLAEAWTGMPLTDINSFAMEQGSILQEEAIPWLALELEKEIESVGFITDDDGRIGCSPDGLMEGCGAEVKCPEAKNHVKYLLANSVPEEYLPQIHGSLYVTGFDYWHFLSYRRGFPKLLLRVERDDKIEGKIGTALHEFMARFDAGWAWLVKLNGGEPPPRPKLTPPESEKQQQWSDVPCP